MAIDKMNMFSLLDTIPEKLIHNQFLFEVLHPIHLELDFQAVMSCKEYLRRWSNSEWPEDNFKIEENLFDLEWHYQEYQQKIAFTYTILNPEKTNCLGCIYIRKTASIQSLTTEETGLLEPYPFFCSYWVIDEVRNTELEKILFSDLNKWLENIWSLHGVLFTTNEQIPEQDVIFRNYGLELFLILQEENRYQKCWRPIKG